MEDTNASQRRRPRQRVAMKAELITNRAELAGLAPGWDELACAAGLPMMAPALVEAWWQHLAPASAEPRVVVLTEGDRLLGVAPFYVDTGRPNGRLDHRLPGIEIAGRLAPVAQMGRERELAEAIARCLAGSSPRPDLIALEGMPADSQWAQLICDSWPASRRPLMWRYQDRGSPAVMLGADSFDSWLAGKSSHFRGHMRRQRRQFAAADGSCRLTTAATLAADIDTFMRLHALRWKNRGRSSYVALGPALPSALRAAGARQLGEEGRFRLQILEVDGEPVSAQLFMAAGGHVLHVNGGWDERFAKLRLHDVALLQAIDDAITRRDRLLDLGVGVMPHKQRFADSDLPICWTVVLPFGRGLPRASLGIGASVAKGRLRAAIKQRLPAEHVERLRRLQSRPRTSERHPEDGSEGGRSAHSAKAASPRARRNSATVSSGS
jgi:CelD/BcsL family acetyltransferase involved in cellulose biosynthesis